MREVPLIAFPRRVYWDERAEDALRSVVEDFGIRSALVVTDGVVSKLEWFGSVVDAVRGCGVDVTVYSDVPPEPPLDIGDRVASAVGRRRPDCIIAIGGGSVIDAAKAALVKLLRPDVGIEEVAPFNPLGVELKRPLLIAVPTTAGTGSDASYGIVLTREAPEGREKVDVASYEVVPYVSILDPRLPLTAPRHLVVGAGLDALGHALEALAAKQSNPLTDALAERTVEEIVRWLPGAVRGSREAMAHVHLAATMAGMAFTGSGLGLIHALAHPLGARLGIHHGTAVGIVTPYVVEFNSRDPSLRGRYERVKALLEAVHGMPARGSLAEHVRALHEAVGFRARLRDHGVSRERFDAVKGKVLEDAFCDPSIAFAPILPTPEELSDLLERMY